MTHKQPRRKPRSDYDVDGSDRETTAQTCESQPHRQILFDVQGRPLVRLAGYRPATRKGDTV